MSVDTTIPTIDSPTLESASLDSLLPSDNATVEESIWQRDDNDSSVSLDIFQSSPAAGSTVCCSQTGSEISTHVQAKV